MKQICDNLCEFQIDKRLGMEARTTLLMSILLSRSCTIYNILSPPQYSVTTVQ